MPQSKKELGEILLAADLVTETQLDHALTLQRTYGERLASILVRQRILTEKFAVTYLGRQLGVPPIDMSKQEVDLALLDVVSLELCERHLVFPVKVEGGRLQLAMSDPMDHVLVSEIEFKSGVRLVPMIALESAIKNAVVEARRARKTGRRTIQPNVQQAKESVLPSPDRVTAETPTATPVLPLEEKERAAFESLASPAPAPAPAARASVGAATVQASGTVLVVDDDESMLDLIRHVLEERGYRVVTAGAGRDALVKVREQQPDLIVLDGMLPEIHGFEICRQLKTSERFGQIPVIIISGVHTGWRFAADVKDKYGAQDYLEKPFELAELVRRIEAQLERTPAPSASAESAARRHLKDGVIALKQGRLQDAVSALEQGLAISQRSDMLHYYLAMTYEKKDMVFHAIDQYEQAVSANPEFYDAITSLANLYQKQEFWRKAVEMWELALQATKDEAVRSRIKQHLMTLL